MDIEPSASGLNLNCIMEVLKDVFTPFYERLRRPFLGAYWLAVVTYNWRIWTALFFYEEKVNGYDKIDFIEGQLNFCNLFVYPVIIALLFILAGSLLDVLVYWYQEWIRNHKKKIKEEFERERMVSVETFNRIKGEREEKTVSLSAAENQITKLSNELKEKIDQRIEIARLSLEPCIDYFLGMWEVRIPQLKMLAIEFRENVVLLSVKEEVREVLNENSRDIKCSKVIHSIERTPSEILLLFGNQIGTTKGLGFLNNDVNEKENLLTLFKSETTFWRIPINNIRQSEFNVLPTNQGGTVIFQRQDSWSSVFRLWRNDTDNQFPLLP